MVENKNLLLGLCGSPRNQGTEFAIHYALNYAAEKFNFETKFWTVRGKTIKFCVHCDYCIREKKGCAHVDNLGEFYPKIEWARKAHPEGDNSAYIKPNRKPDEHEERFHCYRPICIE